MKSKMTRELGLEILDILDKERKRLREKLHPMNLRFREDEHVSFTMGALSQAENIYLKVLSMLDMGYNDQLEKEREKHNE